METDFTPILPGSIWRYRGKEVQILNSYNYGMLWEIELVDEYGNYNRIEIKFDEWLENATFLDEE